MANDDTSRQRCLCGLNCRTRCRNLIPSARGLKAMRVRRYSRTGELKCPELNRIAGEGMPRQWA